MSCLRSPEGEAWDWSMVIIDGHGTLSMPWSSAHCERRSSHKFLGHSLETQVKRYHIISLAMCLWVVVQCHQDLNLKSTFWNGTCNTWFPEKGSRSPRNSRLCPPRAGAVGDAGEGLVLGSPCWGQSPPISPHLAVQVLRDLPTRCCGAWSPSAFQFARKTCVKSPGLAVFSVDVWCFFCGLFCTISSSIESDLSPHFSRARHGLPLKLLVPTLSLPVTSPSVPMHHIQGMTVSQRFSHLREESTGFHLREAAWKWRFSGGFVIER